MCIHFPKNKSPLPGLGHSYLSGQFGQGMVKLILTRLKPFIHGSLQHYWVGSFAKCRDPT